MTPQLALQPEIAAVAPICHAHLTEDQFGELLAQSSRSGEAASSPAEAHLLACEQCAAEVAAMRDSLSLFRDATGAYANNELRRMPQMLLPTRRIFSSAMQPAWWVAAASLVLAAVLPIQLARQHAIRTAGTAAAMVADNSAQSDSDSDEALLEDVDRDTSASVPASMQALADPTASASATAINTSAQTSTQRKD